MPNPVSLQTISHKLETIGQGHLLRFYDQLDDDKKRSLINQLASLDLDAIPKLVREYVLSKPDFPLPLEVQPAPYYALDGDRKWDRDHFRRAGEKLIRAGKVACFTVAGGQGSRLGFEGPKGCYPGGPVSGKPLFELFAEGLLGARDRHAVSVPWYIMTSPLNHAATVAFFEHNRFFGLTPSDVMFFPQGVMPSFDINTGKILLASRHEVATNPDGHGGAIRALHASGGGAIADMRKRNISTISYFQVDNPIVNILDPVFLGLHAAAPDSSAQMSSKMVAKSSAQEKVGVFCAAGAGARKGRVEVVEYSDLPADLSRATNPDGSLKFNAGSIAVHAMSVDFVERLATDPSFALPYHRAEKKVPAIDPATGDPIEPTSNNAVKLERFVFDALPLADKSIVLETDRIEEFAPIKNATGADSPETSARIQTLRAARWLEARGTKISRKPDGAPDCTLEISPRTATCAAELPAPRVPATIAAGAKLAL